MDTPEAIKRACIKIDPSFEFYLDSHGRINVTKLRIKPNLRRLYNIYNRISVQACRRRKNEIQRAAEILYSLSGNLY